MAIVPDGRDLWSQELGFPVGPDDDRFVRSPVGVLSQRLTLQGGFRDDGYLPHAPADVGALPAHFSARVETSYRLAHTSAREGASSPSLPVQRREN